MTELNRASEAPTWATLVVLPQPDYPGWTASVDGAEVPIVRVDDSFPAVIVPAGESRIELEFRPTYLRLSLVVTFLSLGALALTWWVGPLLEHQPWRRLRRG